MTTANALLLLTAETSIHAGAGQSVAGIDLPIQREIHNNWPCVYGSAVKGALRAHVFHAPAFPKSDVTVLFGPDHAAASGDRDSSHAGALLVGDARLLALPVRSLQSCFKWVTCPAALHRFQRDAERLGLPLELPGELPHPERLQAESNHGGSLFLEEFRLEQRPCPYIEQLARQLAKLNGMARDAATLAERLVIVHDDIFSFLVSNATAVNAHIAIDAATKTVKNGALWYEESLPPETIFYMALTATASRSRDSLLSAEEVLARFSQALPAGANWLQLGGNETIGMGWCRVGINHAQA